MSSADITWLRREDGAAIHAPVAPPLGAVVAANGNGHGNGNGARPRRPEVRGKFLFAGSQKLWVRGVTYGTFRPGPDGVDYPDPATVAGDFALMAVSGVNSVRTYTPPPRWLLDLAAAHGLRVLVGLPWEQHVAFGEESRRLRSIESRVRAGVAACAGHPAVLAYAVGNEIPAPIVRWHGRRTIERFVHRLYRAAKAEDPDGLVTYVNFPSTEYLELPFLDFMSFNVYLEARDRLEAYLARLQTLAGDRPLVLAEIGLDSRRHGHDGQARALDWQIRSVFAAGGAGAFAFAWTDEWHRGGHDIEDWDFGLVTRQRRPKPALAAVSRAFAEVPVPNHRLGPRVSVVVCSCNGERTLGDCLEGLAQVRYPNYETIVVDDGSTDATPEIAARHGVRVVSTANRGLSSARNTGLREATGEIVAYIDDDASPDPDWLTYLVETFERTEHRAVGGPNIAPAGDGSIADAVASAPGGPIHVLLSDTEAEHIPGCNMAFRRDALEAIGGFDPQFRAAGDDVDVCWRLQDRGWTIGFAPAAMVWHHRRNSLRTYWRQQRGYGKAEALLERKWPEKYNGSGHVAWSGRMYGRGITMPLLQRRRWRVYYGTWGSGLFQRLYQPSAQGANGSILLMPEWYLLIAGLAVVGALGAAWSKLSLAVPVLAAATVALLACALVNGARAAFPAPPATRRRRLWLKALTSALYLVQPLARLRGRLAHGLTPWRARRPHLRVTPRRRAWTLWSEEWQSPEQRLERLEDALRAEGAALRRGTDWDRWDLEVRVGALGAALVQTATEEHGEGHQLMRFRVRPRIPQWTLCLAAASGVLALIVGFAVWPLACAIAAAGIGLLLGGLAQAAGATEMVEAASAALVESARKDAPDRRARSWDGVAAVLDASPERRAPTSATADA
jgi:GT2 family glycosyltransferase